MDSHRSPPPARPENRHTLDLEIRKADVICILYSISSPPTFDRVSSHWIPYIRSLGRNVPVVLVGNKIDTRGEDVTNEMLEETIMPVMEEFKEVETCVECSARLPLNVSEVFYFAQKAVLHPTAPLYDSREHALKPACVDALRRIFRLCDRDKDGVLDDEELNEFQRKCFSTPLQHAELQSVKDVIRDHDPDGVTETGVTESGFLFLHTLFIQRGRLETTWTVLRRFGYGDDLSLREGFLFPAFDVPPDTSVELSPSGYQFFIDLFTVHDKDKDGALREDELEELFSTSPGNPWRERRGGGGVAGLGMLGVSGSSGQTMGAGFPETTVTNDAGAVTLQGFLAQWSMTTLLDYKTTLAYLAFLGYNGTDNGGDTTSALKVTRPRKFDRRKGKVQRNVFLAYVFGATGSGKTSLLRSLASKPFNPTYQPTSRPISVVNSVETGGVEKYLVLTEYPPRQDAEVLGNSRRLEQADVLVWVYDSSDVNSFAYVAGLRKKYPLDHIPQIFVSTKSDLDTVQQRYEVQPDVYCRNLGLAVPVAVSVKEGFMAELYNLVVGVAMDPAVAIPGSLKITPQGTILRYLTVGAAVGAGVMLLVYMGFRIFFRPLRML
ncbi:ERMES complex Ca(2+)-binding regulatory GTPase gem1 [Gonapodya sp. JEL0774]|nr:ERMES complex Ca(2+)-binding regulatory GTPase gem1 [Gonapodya sp. JEL0774]